MECGGGSISREIGIAIFLGLRPLLACLGGPLLQQFWDDYARLYPTHPVVLDIITNKTDSSLLVPVYVHGDGGRHYRKSEIMVIQFQSVIGQGSRFSSTSRKRKLDEGENDECWGLQFNLQGHSFTTRFLIATMLKQYYHEDVSPLLLLMKHVSGFFGELYAEGVQYRGKVLKFALLGVKGDLPFLSKIASMQRNFLHIRKQHVVRKKSSKSLPGCCWLCSAGKPGFLFEDFSQSAPWTTTMGLENEQPWRSQPTILDHVLHDQLAQPSFFKLDLFHILNLFLTLGIL